MKVLIIEDSADVSESMSLCLQLRWPEATIVTAAEGAKGLQLLEADKYDIAILDINLPDMNGFDVLKELRTESNIPVIIVTVRGMDDDQAKGLEIGADDYIVKPFKPRDLVARVNAVLRRASSDKGDDDEASITSGALSLHLTTNEVHLRDDVLKLTPTECRLLYVLMKTANETLSNKDISQKVWGKDQANNEVVRTYIRRLRNRLKDNPPQIILTQQKEGYRFVTPA
ncbi:MAG: response regulator transcription factor [Chloroflexi bacterium]|jgi:DNA-binding response OmpR family regulator|nr:response regulator transcription factor [Chloroflexota bacterium]MBT7081544.1 response regulator transcription factor [Chloroflexota bacterium]